MNQDEALKLHCESKSWTKDVKLLKSERISHKKSLQPETQRRTMSEMVMIEENLKSIDACC